MGRSWRGYRPLSPSNSSFPLTYWDRLYTPFQAEADAAPVRLIVRRVKPAPGSQLALFATYSYHGFITDRDGETLELEPIIAVTPRSRMRYATSSTASG